MKFTIIHRTKKYKFLSMKYKLREPQQKVLEKIRENISKGNKKILIQACTGFGKTILSYEICRSSIEKGNRVLFTSHRIQLAGQTKDKFSSLNPSYLQGNSSGYNESSLLLVATLQTLINRGIQEPKIIIIDEVHYAYESKLVQSLFERFPNAIFIGLSATPVDDKGYLLEGFDSIIDDYQTEDLIKLGWLVPFKIYCPVNVNLESVPLKGNDYDNVELEKVVNKDDITNSIVENYIKYGEDRKFICFAINKKHATSLYASFTKNGITVEIIDADTTKEQRELYLSGYKYGPIKGLINIEILTAGFDEPTLSCVILACPTKAWKKYIQCCGRGIRLNGNTLEESVINGKSDCILIDCAGAVEEHGLPDARRKFIFGKKISRVIDRELNFDETTERKKEISVEKQVYLKRIGSLLDLYDGKVYKLESELQDDVNSYLEKTDFFWWRQNSGKMFKDGRWIHFASKSGLPDNTVFYKDTSFFFGVELKLLKGTLTDKQKQTLPEMTQRKVLFFIAESVFDVYKIIEFVERNIEISENSTIICNSIYELYDRQIELRTKLKIPLYDARATESTN